MRIFVFLLLFALSLTGTTQNSRQKSRRTDKEQQAYIDALIKEKINSLLRERTFVFYPTYMFPRGRGGVSLGYDYYARLENDSVITYLPFWGTTYVMKSGHESSGYDFSEKFENYKMKRVRKGYKVSFDVDNGSNYIYFTFHISYLGATTLTVSSSKRQSMSYVGAIGEFKKEEIPDF